MVAARDSIEWLYSAMNAYDCHGQNKSYQFNDLWGIQPETNPK